MKLLFDEFTLFSDGILHLNIPNTQKEKHLNFLEKSFFHKNNLQISRYKNS